jgi:hypothetical protein
MQPDVFLVEKASARLRLLAPLDSLLPYTMENSRMNSGLMFFTSGISPIVSTSSTVTRTRLPARSPPAWRLVWPGNDTTVPSENAP